MRVRQLVLAWALSTCSIFADFEIQPYFHKLAQFNFTPLLGGRLYNDVNRLKGARSYQSKDVLVDLNLGVRFLPAMDGQIELDFTHTHRISFGVQRFGAQTRYQFLDDIAGDPVSLMVGAQLFYVPTNNMRDISSPYHGQANLEAGLSVGKEWDKGLTYLARIWGYLGIGQANRGSPWLKPELHLETKSILGRIDFYGTSYIGLGTTPYVNVNNFYSGYSNIEHRSIDLGLKYLAKMGVWGDLHVAYQYRVWAYAYPEKVSNFYIAYRFPFSVL